MKVIDPGHIYEVNQLDGDGTQLKLIFVNREDKTPYPGTQSQEILRVQIDLLNVLIDRTNHLDNQLFWEGNAKIIKVLTEAQRNLNLAILFYEQRVLERKFEKKKFNPALHPIGDDGHYIL